MNYGGFSDWRLPTIKELYSLMSFKGTDPSGFSGTDTSVLTPFIDTAYFNFAYGDPNQGERIIDSQCASGPLRRIGLRDALRAEPGRWPYQGLRLEIGQLR